MNKRRKSDDCIRQTFHNTHTPSDNEHSYVMSKIGKDILSESIRSGIRSLLVLFLILVLIAFSVIGVLTDQSFVIITAIPIGAIGIFRLTMEGKRPFNYIRLRNITYEVADCKIESVRRINKDDRDSGYRFKLVDSTGKLCCESYYMSKYRYHDLEAEIKEGYDLELLAVIVDNKILRIIMK